MIEASGAMGPDALMLQVRRGDIDDFLKSLRLSDPAGGVPTLTLSGPAALDDTFSGLPFDRNALGDLRALLDAMQGAPVQAQRRGVALSGTIMGTRAVPCTTEGAQGCVALALVTESGAITQMPLDDATDLTFTDATDRDAITRGLQALRESARTDALPVTLTSTQDSPRDVALGWLATGPRLAHVLAGRSYGATRSP